MDCGISRALAHRVDRQRPLTLKGTFQAASPCGWPTGGAAAGAGNTINTGAPIATAKSTHCFPYPGQPLAQPGRAGQVAPRMGRYPAQYRSHCKPNSWHRLDFAPGTAQHVLSTRPVVTKALQARKGLSQRLLAIHQLLIAYSR